MTLRHYARGRLEGYPRCCCAFFALVWSPLHFIGNHQWNPLRPVAMRLLHRYACGTAISADHIRCPLHRLAGPAVQKWPPGQEPKPLGRSVVLLVEDGRIVGWDKE